jgi:uncharacterized membrane protein
MFATVAVYWNQLPDRVPTHFNASGNPNVWGPKGGIWILPITGVGIYVSLTVLSGFAAYFSVPFAVDRSRPEVLSLLRRTAIAMKTTMVLTFAYISWATVRTALGAATGLGPILLPVTLSVIIVPAWFLIRLRRYHVQG